MVLVQLLYLESGGGGGGIVYNLSVDGVFLGFLFSVSNLLVCLVYAFMILLSVLISILSISFYIFVA